MPFEMDKKYMVTYLMPSRWEKKYMDYVLDVLLNEEKVYWLLDAFKKWIRSILEVHNLVFVKACFVELNFVICCTYDRGIFG